MKPEVSVVIPCYNDGRFLGEAIRSVEQHPERSRYEILIVNDGSTDEATLREIRGLEAAGYRVLTQENQGLARARNNGIAASAADFILPLDSDNKIRPAYLDRGISVLQQNARVGVVYGDALRFGDLNEYWRVGRFDLRRLLTTNYIDACVVLRKEVWREAGGYDPNISAIADWDMNLSAASHGWDFHYVPEILFEYRVRGDSMIKTYNNEQASVEYIARKHALLYRQQLVRETTLRQRAQLLARDAWARLAEKLSVRRRR